MSRPGARGALVQTSALDDSTIVDPRGRPARTATDTACPQCGAGKAKRVKSGMGDPHPVCGTCGHEWHEEHWDG